MRPSWRDALGGARALLVLTAAIVLLSGCSSDDPKPNNAHTAPAHSDPVIAQDTTFVVQHDGKWFCGYITEATRDLMCGDSGVPDSHHVSPEKGETFDPEDGVDTTDNVVAFLLCSDRTQAILDNHGGTAEHELADSWRAANSTVCAAYDEWIFVGQPTGGDWYKKYKQKARNGVAPTKSATPRMTPAPSKSATRPSATTSPAKPTPKRTVQSSPTRRN